MRARALLVTTSLLATGLSAVAAQAATVPPSCNMAKDGTGDTNNDLEGAPVFPADQGLDLVGGDVASNAKNITAVIRLAAAPGDATIYVKRYIAQFKVAGQSNPMVLAAAISATGTTYSFGWYGETTTGTGFNYSSTPATGSIDDKTITITASLADVAAQAELGAVKKGAKVNALTLSANRRLPALTQAPGFVYPADEAIGKGVYYAGNASCVKVPA
ncbi:MAG TPA: hypothetical protein VGX28_11405 [Frankiaceae bacterium]|nr:hypothetical protein [Frankiaceae bacterium]